MRKLSEERETLTQEFEAENEELKEENQRLKNNKEKSNQEIQQLLRQVYDHVIHANMTWYLI